jgi:hypothetical protein
MTLHGRCKGRKKRKKPEGIVEMWKKAGDHTPGRVPKEFYQSKNEIFETGRK